MAVDDFEIQLQAERPEIDPDFVRRLDHWAAAGFPRGGWQARGGLLETLGRFRDRLRATPPRRLVVPIGAAAAFVLVVGVGIKAIDDSRGPDQGLSAPAPQSAKGGQELAAPSSQAARELDLDSATS
jgi:hypothetical protein